MRIRLAIVLPLLLVASGAIWWVASPGAAQQTLTCNLRQPQPEHPLEMNTIVSDPRTSQFRSALFKHVIMEKEIFDCVENLGQPDERFFTRDVETFIEIIQRAEGGRTTPVEKRVEEIICDMGTTTPTFTFGGRCSARDVPLQEGAPNTFCFPPDPQLQPKDPVAMNTAITSRQDTVKTIKVDKEIVDCDSGGLDPLPGHLYLFTEIVEARLGGAADTIRPTEKKFQAIICFVPQGGRGIDTCHHFIPGSTNG